MFLDFTVYSAFIKFVYQKQHPRGRSKTENRLHHEDDDLNLIENKTKLRIQKAFLLKQIASSLQLLNRKLFPYNALEFQDGNPD